MRTPVRDLRFQPTSGVFAGKARPESTRASGPREPCQVPGCKGTTNGGKPYCLEHIDQMPYVIGMEGRRP